MVGLSLLLIFVQAPAAAPVAKPLPAADENKVVCKLVTEGESRIPLRICRTKAQWDEMAEENQRDVRSSRNQRSCGSAFYC